MSLRRLCNIEYALLAEGRDKDGLRDLDEVLTVETIEELEARRGFRRQQQLLSTLGAGGGAG